MPVVEITTGEVICLTPDMPVEDAHELLERFAVDVAPVVDQDHHPLGLAFARDLARAAGSRRATDDEREPDRLFAPARRGVQLPLDGGFHLDRPAGPVVADLMTPTALQLSEHSSIALVAGMMHRLGLAHAVITDAHGRVVSVVRPGDIARWLSETSTQAPPPPHGAVLGAPKRRYRRPFPFRKAQRTSILVVEDDAEICDALVNLLEDEGFSAYRACDGRQALQVLSDLPIHPGLILLDLMMPRMNGWQFRDEQLRDDILRKIPVVVLSAHGTSIAERERMAPAAVLRKPVTAEALLDTVEQHFQRFN